MNQQISNLKPNQLWQHFAEILKIPRPSGKEQKIIQHLQAFGKRLGLPTYVDTVGNVIIKKPATAGMEYCKGIILQAHLDMVPQKNTDIVHDFEKDAINAYIDGDWVKANGTTLGADNGIGVAAIMAVLESKTIKHPQIEALFTVDEETGLVGVMGLGSNLLTGEILLNLDTGNEGEICIGCAGGVNANIDLPYTPQAVPDNMSPYIISVTKLKGGHSGVDIGLGRGNAIKIMFRFLFEAQKRYGLLLSSIDAGSVYNAIPREALAQVLVPNDAVEAFKKAIVEYEQIVKRELVPIEPDLEIVARRSDMPKYILGSEIQRQLILAIYATPNGVIRYSTVAKGTVETSTNLAIVKSKQDVIEIKALLRSSVDTAIEDLQNMFESVYALVDAKISFDGRYPGWAPNTNSSILQTLKEVYKSVHGKSPRIVVVHGGLECALLGKKYPGCEMVSFGPTIRHQHSPDEKVNIKSVQRFWDFLVKVLEYHK